MKKIFLAGGITDPDWREDLIYVLTSIYKLPVTCFNPYNPEGGDTAKQIAWEHAHLSIADTIVFWFPSTSLCPISLFELGYWLHSEKEIFLGFHPEYGKKENILKQMDMLSCERRVHIFQTLEHLPDKMGVV